MCVIVYKPAKISLSKADIKDMFEANPHGAGLAWLDEDGESIYLNKGLMTLEQTLIAVKLIQKKDAVIHFRYATHGRINPAQTHPFVVDPKIRTAKACHVEGPYKSVLFHNGILSGFGDKNYSDTLDFVVRILSKIPGIRERLDLLNITDGKFALIQDGDIWLTDGFHTYKGLSVSNLNFRGSAFLKEHWKTHEVSASGYTSLAPYGGTVRGYTRGFDPDDPSEYLAANESVCPSFDTSHSSDDPSEVQRVIEESLTNGKKRARLDQ